LLPEFGTLKTEPAWWRWRYPNISIKQFGIQFEKFLLKSKTAMLILDYQGLGLRKAFPLAKNGCPHARGDDLIINKVLNAGYWATMWLERRVLP
jgi:hypothetical protein